MKRIFYLLTIILSAGLFCMQSSATQAQSRVLLTERNSVSYVFDYQPRETGSYVYVNRMLQSIDRGNPKRLQDLRFIINTDYILQITSRANNRYEVFLNFEHFDLSGDFIYKGFPVSDVMKPAAIGASITIGGRAGENLPLTISPKHFQGLPFSLNAYFDNDTINIRRIQLNEVNYIYDNSSLQQLNAKLQYIDEYYMTDRHLDRVMYDLNQIDPLALEQITQNITAYEQSAYLLQQMHMKNFPHRLNLALYDPVQFLPRFHAASELSARVGYELDRVSANIDQKYYDRGLQSYQKNEFSSAIYDFNQAIRFNPDNQAARLRLGLTQLITGDTINAMANLTAIANAQQVKPQERDEAVNSLKAIFENKINRGKTAAQQNRHQEAYILFVRATEMCERVNAIACTNSLKTDLRNTAENLFTEKLKKVDELATNKQFSEAEALLNEAEEFTELHPEINRSRTRIADATQSVHQKWYDDEMNRSRSLVQNQNYEQALQTLESAGERAEAYQLKKANDWNKLATKSAENHIIEMSSTAVEYVEDNQVRTAESILSELNSISNRYRLQQKEPVKIALTNLKDAVEHQICLNANNAINRLLNQVMEHESRQDFISARKDLEQAMRIGEENQNCDLDLSNLYTEIERVAPLAVYQTKIERAEQFILDGNYLEAVEAYLQAEVYYENNGLSVSGLPHIELMDFLKQRGHQPLNEASVAYFIGNNMHEKALSMLQFFAQNRIRSNATIRNLQRQLGEIFAQRDFYLNPPPNPSVKVEEYTLGERRLRFLKRKYMRTWRNL